MMKAFTLSIAAILLSTQIVMADSSAESDDGFLRIMPDDTAEHVEPFTGTKNEEFRTCEIPKDLYKWLYKVGNRPQRDVYDYLRSKNVLETHDCGCSGKVLPLSKVMPFWNKLVEKYGRVTSDQTEVFFDESERLDKIVRASCGGPI